MGTSMMSEEVTVEPGALEKYTERCKRLVSEANSLALVIKGYKVEMKALASDVEVARFGATEELGKIKKKLESDKERLIISSNAAKQESIQVISRLASTKAKAEREESEAKRKVLVARGELNVVSNELSGKRALLDEAKMSVAGYIKKLQSL